MVHPLSGTSEETLSTSAQAAILGSAFGDRWMVGHTLVAALAQGLMTAYWFPGYVRTWGTVLAYGSLLRLPLDETCREPRALLWPPCGYGLARHDESGWPVKMARAMFTAPTNANRKPSARS